jgi:hypothetical protein
MTPGWLHRQRGRRWLVALLLPVLAARLLVPQGFMPSSGADHGLTLQMCHGAGPVPAGVERASGSETGEPGSDTPHDAPCLFASTGSAAPPPVLLASPTIVPAPEGGAPRFVPSPPQRPLHHDHSPRAPPSAL